MLQIQKSSPAGRSIGSIGGGGKTRFEARPCEERPGSGKTFKSIRIFQFAPPQGATPRSSSMCVTAKEFQFAPLREGRPCSSIPLPTSWWHFNSLPRVGGDMQRRCDNASAKRQISIRAPARERLAVFVLNIIKYAISIRAPTRGRSVFAIVKVRRADLISIRALTGGRPQAS